MTLSAALPLTDSESGHRLDFLLVADMVEPGSRVLDIGCGDGSLLAILRDRKGVDGRGIEISREGVNACLTKGLAVIQCDADTVGSARPEADAEVIAMATEGLEAAGRIVTTSPDFGCDPPTAGDHSSTFSISSTRFMKGSRVSRRS